MSQRQRMQGQPMFIMGEDSERVKDRDAQEYNISAARAVAEAVRSTLGPKGMDKMLVDSMGDVTVTNDGVTILQEMDIDNPTAEMIVEVAETQDEEAGDGTTTAVAVAGELLKRAEDLLEQDVHPTAIIGGFRLASEEARAAIDEVVERVDTDDEDLLEQVAETAMTGKGAEANVDLLASLVVEAVRRVTVEADDGTNVVDLQYVDIEKQSGRAASESELLRGAVLDKDPLLDEMETDREDAKILLLRDPLEVESTDADTTVSIDDPGQLRGFLDREHEQLREKVQHIVDIGADVVFCQKGIDDPAHHMLAEEGILATRRTKKSDIQFLKNVTGAHVVSDLESATADDLGRGSIERDEAEGLFYITGEGDETHGVTLLVRGSTQQVVDEIDRNVQDALDAVSSTVADGRIVAGGGAVEVAIAGHLRDVADGVEGREQLAVEAFADAVELVPRVLAENAGLDAIDVLVDLRAAHEEGETRAGLDIDTGGVVDTFDSGVLETAFAKEQAIASAAEAANLVLKIDDIIAAGGDDDEGAGGPGGGPGGGMGGMGGMGGAM